MGLPDQVGFGRLAKVTADLVGVVLEEWLSKAFTKGDRMEWALTYCSPIGVVKPWPQCWQLYLNPSGELGERVQTLPLTW